MRERKRKRNRLEIVRLRRELSERERERYAGWKQLEIGESYEREKDNQAGDR